jgi:predicted transcriptional regulator
MQLSQEELAAILQINQASVAKMEKRTDMYVGTVRRFIQAMGGELEIIARFPDREIKIDQFAEEKTPASAG